LITHAHGLVKETVVWKFPYSLGNTVGDVKINKTCFNVVLQVALLLQRDRTTRLSVKSCLHMTAYTALSIVSCGKNWPYCIAHQV